MIDAFCMVSCLLGTLFSAVQRLVPRDGGRRRSAGCLWIHTNTSSNCTLIIYHQYSANRGKVLQLSVGEKKMFFFRFGRVVFDF